jgi:hypothetical protein
MFFITAVDFWIHRLEEHMQKTAKESFGIPEAGRGTAAELTAEWLIINLFKTDSQTIPLPQPPSNTQEYLDDNALFERIDFPKYKMQYGEAQVQFNYVWKHLILGETSWLKNEMEKSFNPQKTSILLAQFKLLLIFRLQQQCVELRKEAYERLIEQDRAAAEKAAKEQKEREEALLLEALAKKAAAGKAAKEQKEREEASLAEVQVKTQEVAGEEDEGEDYPEAEDVASEEESELAIVVAQLKQANLVAKSEFESKSAEKPLVPDSSDKALLDAIVTRIEEAITLMRLMEDKAKVSIFKQLNIKPSDGDTGDLLCCFRDTVKEIFGFFSKADAQSGLLPTHEHALIDGSPEKVRAKNNPLLIAYEKMVPYLIGNFGQLSHNNHLRHDVGWMDSAAKYFTKPAAAFSDTVNYWTYAPNIAKQKRDTLLAAILTLRKSVKGTQLLEANGSPNEGLWENFTRAFDTQLKPVAALKPTGSQQPQAITMLYTSTIEALREAQADLKEKAKANNKPVVRKKSSTAT